MTNITFKDGIPYVEYKPVRNIRFFLKIFKKHFKKIEEYPIAYSLCGIGFVSDGESNFVYTGEQMQHIPHGNCNCGVPNEVHGTCCGWANAKTIIDERLRICDDRHPFYNKNFNEFINSNEFRSRSV